MNNQSNSEETSALTKKAGTTPVESSLMKFGEETFNDFSRYRFAEEREWYQLALFYQRRQWLNWNNESRRWEKAKPNSKKPRPQPVSNYFAKTVNANANALGAELPKFLATPTDDDPANRHAAEVAERAKDAIDKESGMKILNPLLAKHTALWGIGVTKDYYDLSESNGITKVNQLQLSQTMNVGCLNCGAISDVGATPALDESGQIPCPNCAAPSTPYPELNVDGATQQVYAKGKICTEVVAIFDVFLPRDCRNPNLAKRVLQRSRRSIGNLERMYPDAKGKVKADQQLDLHEQQYTALKSLVNYNYFQEQTSPCATVTEYHSYWEELSKELQDTLTENFQSEPDTLTALIERGLYCVYAPGLVLDWGVNPLYNEDTGQSYLPYTFFCWEMDPANIYNKSVGTDLVPLQISLNRVDALIQLSFMCNAAGKWLWPRTQTTNPPTGSPNEVIEYDVIGTGKTPPTFVQPNPISAQVWQYRQTILGDFQQLGLTEAVSTGSTPAGGGPTAFRALAYLGSKAAEQINTQRTLWETAHQLRYEKTLLMAKMYWDEPRRVKVAAANGKYKMQAFTGAELKGSYDIEFVPDSSRPKSVQEQQAAVSMLFQAGLINPADPAVREYLVDMAGVNGVNLTDHLQYEKSERMLDQVIRGEQPSVPSSFNYQIGFKIFSDYLLTEEYETLEQEAQQRVAQFQSLIQLKLAEDQLKAAGIQAPTPSGLPGGAAHTNVAGGPGNAHQVGKAIAEHAGAHAAGPSQELQAVPGRANPSQQPEAAAAAEGNNVASQLP